jgi:hypothetical protein
VGGEAVTPSPYEVRNRACGELAEWQGSRPRPAPLHPSPLTFVVKLDAFAKARTEFF